ncbi:MAG: TIGR03086 family metal-binding protein [Actinomycetota bacterium]|nr:TIGR03086 family metal-binding protein [Actinomycetota bacterium]
MSDAAARHRAHAGTFSARVRGVGAWDAPAPVAGWTARDVVRHLTEWFPPFLAAGSGIQLPKGPSVDDDPVGAWQHHADAVQAVLDDDTTMSLIFDHPHVPARPLHEAIDSIYTSDVFMHTWDLARATGQDDALDPAECERMLVGMEEIDDILRASGQFGPKVAVPADADPTTRLMAFIGRDPNWSPTSG